MKVLLIGINSKFIHPNIAIHFLATYAKEQNPKVQIDILEFTIKDTTQDIIDKITLTKYDLIGFSAYIWNITLIYHILNGLKQTNSHNSKIVLGGPEVSYNQQEVLSTKLVDFIISGEGEIGFAKLISVLYEGYINKSQLLTVPSISFFDNNIFYKTNEQVIKSLDVLPSVYTNSNLEHWSNKLIYIESSRGCPYSCSFCVAGLENNVRLYSPNKIFEEITYLQQSGGKTFKFLDRTFNVNKKHMLKIFDWIIKNHCNNSVFQFEVSLSSFPLDIIDYLNEHAPTGLFRFEIGIQSFNDLANTSTSRTQDNNLLIEKISKLTAGGRVILHVDLIAGLPHESFISFAKTFDKTFLLWADELQLGFLKLLHGTPIKTNSHTYGYIYDNEPPYEIISNDYISNEELNKIHTVEEVLEKYYNAPRLKNTLKYIFSNYDLSPFDFLLNFGLFYEHKYSWKRTQLDELYTRFNEFILLTKLKDDFVIRSFIKFDYLIQCKIKPKIWWDKLDKGMRNDIIRKLHRKSKKYDLNFLFKNAIILKSHYDFKNNISCECLIIGFYEQNKFIYEVVYNF